MRTFTLICFGLFACGLAVAPAKASSEMQPEDIVRLLYADYMSGPGKNLPTQSAEDKIRPYATRGLQKAIDENDRCEKNSREVCAIDFDYIIAGQDWGKLLGFRIDRRTVGESLIVRARFREQGMGPDTQVVQYTFVKEDDAWKIDDVADGGDSLKNSIESYFKEYDDHNNPRHHKPK
ncbi:MAG TPA: DUF3828 domain-containing protein [Rhizomicrobium sp.]|nr:DUF3828 domain-containing protein [Rhizomicrobium sp.]